MTDPLLQRASEAAPPTLPPGVKRASVPPDLAPPPASLPPQAPPPLPPSLPPVVPPVVPPWLTLGLVVTGAATTNLAGRAGAATAIGAISVGVACTIVLSVPGRRRPTVMVPLLVAALLATNLVLRTSPWVIGPTIIAAVAFLLMATHDRFVAPQPLAALRSLSWYLLDLIDTVPWLARPLGRWARSARGSTNRGAVLRGLVVSGGIVMVLSVLLASADALFASLLGDLFGGSAWSHLIVTGLLLVPVGALGVGATARPRPLPSAGRPQQTRLVEGFMGLTAIATVLATWCGLQLVVALGGADRLLATEGLTRAQYARQGFFQMVAVVVVVIALLRALDRWTTRSTRQERLAFTGLGLLVTVETGILVATSYSRIDLYVDAFGWTMLRLSVTWFLAWLALVLTLVAARLAGVGTTKPWVQTGSLLMAALVTIGFGWSNPEAFVTRWNIEQSQTGELELDTEYLLGLSTDTILTLADRAAVLDVEQQQQIKSELCQRQAPSTGYGPLGWNRSVGQANDAIANLCNGAD